MSISTSLLDIYTGLSDTLESCNSAIEKKGGDAASTLLKLPDGIDSIRSFPEGGITPEMTTFIDCKSSPKTLDPGIDVPLAVENAERLAALETSQFPHLAPDYVRTAAEELAEKVRSRQAGFGFTFAFLADLHYGCTTDPQNVSITHAAQALETLAENCHLDAVVFGGDIVDAEAKDTKQTAAQKLTSATKLFGGVAPRVPQIWLPGNNDDAPYLGSANRLTFKELYANLCIRNKACGAITDPANTEGNYGYVDFPTQYVRLIYLNTVDKPKANFPSDDYSSGGDDSYLNAHNISGKQIKWLIDDALDLSDKDYPPGWRIIVCSHAPIDVSEKYEYSGEYVPYFTDSVLVILQAFANAYAGRLTVDDETYSYDFNTGNFAASKRGMLTCVIHGHSHALVSNTLDRTYVPIVGCPNVMNGRENASQNGTTYKKTPGTANDTAFTVLTLDMPNKKLYAYCYGAGYDREMTF